jgi:hypothetical protein
MNKIRILICLTTLTFALAAAAPAYSWFQAGTKGAQVTSGPLEGFPHTIFIYIRDGGGVKAAFTCRSNLEEGGTGFWTVQGSKEVILTKPTKEQTQSPTKLGPHLAITIQKWGVCEANLGTSKNFPAKLSECRIQIAQLSKTTKEGSATASFQTDCTLEVPEQECTITIEQNKANQNLKKILVRQTKAIVQVLANPLAQFSYKGSLGCELDGVSKESSEGEIEPFEAAFELGGVSLV